jgi:phosphomannomutase
MAERVNPAIFRAYDIRGLVDVDLTDATLQTLGQAIGTYFRRLEGRTLVVGRDARLSSPRFQAVCIEGLRRTGINVIDIGEVPTPLMYFAVEHLRSDGGLIISASHNPPEYNGIKLRRSHPVYGGEPFSSAAVQEIEQIANAGHFAEGQGTLEQVTVDTLYVQSVARLLPLPAIVAANGERKPRVVLDGGNGVAGPVALRTLEAVGAEVIPLYIEPDGRFPHHHPDPLKAENLQDLRATVQQHAADLGIALDGDGDRLGVVDDQGAVVWADRYLIVLARSLLARRQGPVIFDVKCSTVLPDAVRSLGGTPIMWKTGYSNISAKMRATDAVLGGELSGHTFSTFPGHYYDDGAFAGAHLLYALAQLYAGGAIAAPTLSTALAPYPVLPALPEGRIPFPDATKFQAIAYVRSQFLDQYPLVDIDGVRVDFGDGWGLVRASNTEPALTTRFEAATEERLFAIRDLMLATIADFRATGGEG